MPHLFKQNPLFISSYAAIALNVGVQVVFVAWLAAGVLDLSVLEIGWVQFSLLFPNLALFLLGGTLADRMPPARIMTIANLGLGFVHGFFALHLLTDTLSFISLLFYALALGAGNVFVQTAKERFVAQQTEQALHRCVSLACAVQFTAQACGILAASLGDLIGPAGVAIISAAICWGATALFIGMQKRSAGRQNDTSHPFWQALLIGVQQVWSHRLVRSILLIVGFNGFVHMGFFLVLMPMLARETMGRSAWGFVVLQLTFMVGSVVAHIRLAYKEQNTQPVQSSTFCVLYAGLIALALSYQTTIAGLFILIFCWGAVAGVSANVSRVAVLSATPDALRGRAMSLYQLILFGAAPFGSMLCGFLLSYVDISTGLIGVCVVSTMLFVVFNLVAPRSVSR